MKLKDKRGRLVRNGEWIKVLSYGQGRTITAKPLDELNKPEYIFGKFHNIVFSSIWHGYFITINNEVVFIPDLLISSAEKLNKKERMIAILEV